MGPGTMLTPVARVMVVEPSMTNAAVPKSSFREASLTATATLLWMALAMLTSLQFNRVQQMAQWMDSGSCLSREGRSYLGGSGGGRAVAVP